MANGVSIKEIAKRTSCEFTGDGDLLIKGVAPIETALETDICLARTKEYMKKIPASKAGVFIVPEKAEFTDKNYLIHPNPYAVFAKIIEIFYPLEKKPEKIAPTAVTGENFSKGTGVYIGDNAVIGDNVSLGDNVYIYPGTVICDNVSIDQGTRINPNVTIYPNSIIGKRCIIHSGTIVGSDGFGFAPDIEGWVKINHLGRVVIGDDVEIGASNTIDRGTFGDTKIGNGVKTDNQVHIAHNVELGDKTIIVGQSGVAGSTKIGSNCIIAGKSGVSGHLEIGDNVIVGPMSGVTGNLKNGSVVSGVPEMPHKLWLKAQKIVQRLPDLRSRILKLEKKIKAIEDKNEK